MNFAEYLRTQRGNATHIATTLCVGNAYISQLASGYRTISPVRAVQIEKITNGLVSRQELRPDDWHLLWPELIKSTQPKKLTKYLTKEPLDKGGAP